MRVEEKGVIPAFDRIIQYRINNDITGKQYILLESFEVSQMKCIILKFNKWAPRDKTNKIVRYLFSVFWHFFNATHWPGL